MTTKECLAKIEEMFEDDKEFVRKRALHLLLSGTVDIEKYDSDEYTLPKIVLWAVYHDLLFQRHLRKEDMKDAKNLTFIQ